jgi:hypothetical protein
MTMRKDLQIFVKINSYGVIFIAILILSICSMGFYGFSNTAYTSNRTQFD